MQFWRLGFSAEIVLHTVCISAYESRTEDRHFSKSGNSETQNPTLPTKQFVLSLDHFGHTTRETCRSKGTGEFRGYLVLLPCSFLEPVVANSHVESRLPEVGDCCGKAQLQAVGLGHSWHSPFASLVNGEFGSGVD